MIMIRDTFQCKWGKGDEMVALMESIFSRQANRDSGVYSARIMTDASGRFFTVVSEMVMDSVEAHRKLLSQAFETAEFGEQFARMTELVEHGSREFFNIAVEFNS